MRVRMKMLALLPTLLPLFTCGDQQQAITPPDAGPTEQPFVPQLAPDYIQAQPVEGVTTASPMQTDYAVVRPEALYFAASMMPEVADWEPGRIVVSAPGKNPAMGNPMGYARKVVSVTKEGDMYKVVTEQAAITDLLSGELQVRLDNNAVPLDPSTLDPETFKHLTEQLYGSTAEVDAGFYQLGESLRSDAPNLADLVHAIPGRPIFGWIASKVDQAASNVCDCKPGSAVVNAASDFIEKKTDNLSNAGAAALAGLKDGDVQALFKSAKEIKSFFTPPSITIGSIERNVDASNIVVGPLKFKPFPAGFEAKKSISSKGNTFEFFAKGNAEIEAAFQLKPAFQFGLKIAAPNELTGWMNIHARTQNDIKLKLELEAGLRSVTMSGIKLDKGTQAFKDRVERSVETASEIYNFEREKVMGEEDLRPHSSFTKNLLRSTPYLTTFQVGPVPVVIAWTAQLDLVCGFEAKAKVEATFNWKEQHDFKIKALISNQSGISFEDPSFERSNTETSYTLLGGGKANVQCGLVPRINALLYDAIGINVGVRGALEAEVKYASECQANTTTPKAKLTGGLYFGVGIPVGGKLNVPGTSHSINTPEFDIWNKRWPLTTFAKDFDTGIGYCTPLCKNNAFDMEDEADQDCGGACVLGCSTGKRCTKNNDCVAGLVCTGGVCGSNTCIDGVLSGTETDVDCGGSCDAGCAVGGTCKDGGDCASGFCKIENGYQMGACVATSCEDGVLSGNEAGIDCGGSCGGCGVGAVVMAASSCASNYGRWIAGGYVCVASHCEDGVASANETGWDCGGDNTCSRCGYLQACEVSNDCQAGYVCENYLFKQRCIQAPEPRCDDRIRNGSETGVDCGGSCANACGLGNTCSSDSGCSTGLCELGANGGVCVTRALGTIAGVPAGGTVRLRLQVQDAAAEIQSYQADGAVAFATNLRAGKSFSVVVEEAPANFNCTVANGNGTVGVTPTNTLQVSCVRTHQYLNARVMGLTNGSAASVQNNGGGTVVFAADGTQRLATLAVGAAYNVTVPANPVGHTCTVASGQGTMGASEIIVDVTCVVNTYAVVVTISGSTGTVLIGVNGGTNVIGFNGSTEVSPRIAYGASYDITVQQSPAGQTCVVGNGQGTMGTANVTNVTVTCTTRTHALGGMLTGASGSVTLANGSEQRVVSNGAFTFATPVAVGSSYNVTVVNAPASQSCTVTNGQGTMPDNAVGNVSVNCVTNTFTVGGTVSGLTGTLRLYNNGGDELAISANGEFTFATRVNQGSGYSVTVFQQPVTSYCTIASGSGTATANITNVQVQCSGDIPKRVFVTSQNYKGNMGGLAGAAARCQQLADAAGLTGTYKAWLSGLGAQDGPKWRFSQSTLPYVRIDGVRVADNWADLTDGTLQAPINVTEQNQAKDGAPVWTATNTDGGNPQSVHCDDWTRDNQPYTGLQGNSGATNSSWTSAGGFYCDSLYALYCFQQ